MVLEINLLRRIFEYERGEVRGGRRKVRSEKLHSLYSSANIIIVLRSRRMRWEGHVAILVVHDQCLQNYSWRIITNRWEDMY
jgi:hypothetical protein